VNWRNCSMADGIYCPRHGRDTHEHAVQPHTEDDVRAVSRAIGVASVDDLLDEIRRRSAARR